MDAEQRWPRGLLRDLDGLSVDRHDASDSGRRSESHPRVYRPRVPHKPNGNKDRNPNRESRPDRPSRPPRKESNSSSRPRSNHSTKANLGHKHDEKEDEKDKEETSDPIFPTKKSLILCFDGTGNKFQGSAGDSNILKIYSMLDKEDPHLFRYYQPGIGTYVESSSMSKKSRIGRIKSWYTKAKDQAVGTSFGEHVMAGYKFLMRYYTAGDDIYFFGMCGFSRGAYTARFLAQMLDYIGLLSTGNEEMLRFAWKTFSRWQMRTESSEKEKEEKKETFRYMEQFRETFSRPVDPIRFVGLFDCVNSVPQFEAAWMKRSRFPYTTTMSADVIRHAVSIDERRAKFRQDLISQAPPKNARHHHLDEYMQWMHLDGLRHKEDEKAEDAPQRPDTHRNHSSQQERFRPRKQPQHYQPQERPQQQRQHHHHRNSRLVITTAPRPSTDSGTPVRERFDDGYGKPRPRPHHHHRPTRPRRDDDQDISEVWFAGEHADVGGGWWLLEDETRPASDLPLIWMLREAMRAGMPIDEVKLARAQYHAGEMVDSEDEEEIYRLEDGDSESDRKFDPSNDDKSPPSPKTKAQRNIHPLTHLATRTRLHDSLSFSGGLPWASVVTWQIMEHLPFRRMDLQSDGTWKPISWPLPRGETRDMPDDAQIHGSVIARMRADPNYRPGNLILGGGGRGVRRAPPEARIGEWVPVVAAKGVGVGGAFVRARRRTTRLGVLL